LISGYCVFYKNILLDFLRIKYEVRIEKLLKLDSFLEERERERERERENLQNTPPVASLYIGQITISHSFFVCLILCYCVR